LANCKKTTASSSRTRSEERSGKGLQSS